MDEGRLPQHEMVLEKVDDTGAEEWFCPTCGRRFLMQWPPEYRKVILESGDINAIHMGSKNGVQAEDTNSETTEITSQAEIEALERWGELLDLIDFESLWDKEL